jgi:hypothetical protein
LNQPGAAANAMTCILRKWIPSLLLLSLFVDGCSHAGSQFVGKWVNAKNANDTMEITRKSDQFVILVSHSKSEQFLRTELSRFQA